MGKSRHEALQAAAHQAVVSIRAGLLAATDGAPNSRFILVGLAVF